MDNVETNSIESSEAISLDSVVRKVQHWRANKHDKRYYKQPEMPDELWLDIFSLEKDFKSSFLIYSLRLNTGRYRDKRKQLLKKDATPLPQHSPVPQKTKPQEKNDEPISFCEINVASPESTAVIPPLTEDIEAKKKERQSLRSNDNDPMSYLDLTTVIVECIRPDGRRLKIHATSKSLTEVMNAFYNTGDIEP